MNFSRSFVRRVPTLHVSVLSTNSVTVQNSVTVCIIGQPRPQGFSLKKWVGWEKALASAGHVHSLNIPEKLIYMQPVGFALTEVEKKLKIHLIAYYSNATSL